MRGDLESKKVLVTGAGRGLGKAIADEIVLKGGTVYGTSRDPATANAISERYGTVPLVMDMRDNSSIADGVDQAINHAGQIDMLVNSAGINAPRAAVDVTEDEWNLVHDTNVKGTFFVSQAIARHWIRKKVPGAIVTVASQAGIVAIEERAAYGSSKAAVIHLTKLLALEWAAHGIRVNAVAPTFVRTELTASTLDRPDWAAELLNRIPLGRFGEPGEVASAVTFLLSDASSLVTGHTLVADGGYTIR